jgi:hypothetical protein
MAAEDFKTRREVGIAIEGIKHRLNLMTGVFAVSVFIGAGALGYVASRVEMVANRGLRRSAGLDQGHDR